MKIGIIVTILLLGFILVSGCTSNIVPENGNSQQKIITISSCGVLDQQGARYMLDSDIQQTIDSQESLNCIIIGADDITLDCQNHSIIGDDYDHNDYISTSKGISNPTLEEFNNITIKNCKLDTFTIGIQSKINNSSISNNELSNITGSIPIYIWGSDNTIADNLITSNNPGGIQLEGSGNTVTNNTITDNHGMAISVFGSEQIVKDNKIENNGGGIRLSSLNSIVENNIIKNNNGVGINISNSPNNNELTGNKIISNEIESNGQWGIYIEHSSGNTISNNKISGHSLSGIYFAKKSPENTIIGNEVISNGSGISMKFRYNKDVSNDNTFTDNIFCDNKREDYEADTLDFSCKEIIICRQYDESYQCIDEETIPRTIDGGGNIWGGEQETICGVTRESSC